MNIKSHSTCCNRVYYTDSKLYIYVLVIYWLTAYYCKIMMQYNQKVWPHPWNMLYIISWLVYALLYITCQIHYIVIQNNSFANFECNINGKNIRNKITAWMTKFESNRNRILVIMLWYIVRELCSKHINYNDTFTLFFITLIWYISVLLIDKSHITINNVLR